jgi:hypothetical protein
LNIDVNETHRLFPGSSYLVINTTGTTTGFPDDSIGWSGLLLDPGQDPKPEGFSAWQFREDNEWLHLDTTRSGVGISLSICYSGMYSTEFHIQSYGASNRTEIAWSGSALSDFDSSEPLRRQLGVEIPNQSLEARGVLQLREKASWWTNLFDPATSTYVYTSAEAGWNLSTQDFVFEPRTARFYSGYDFDIAPDPNFIGLHSYYDRLFQYILQDTGRPAFALQAWYTTLFQTAYYDGIGDFDISALAEFDLFVPVLMPDSFDGFAAASSVIMVHLFVVAIVLSMFLSRSKFSRLGDSWYTISQISSSETQSIILQRNVLSDNQVSQLLKSEGRENMGIWIKELSDNRIGIMKSE